MKKLSKNLIKTIAIYVIAIVIVNLIVFSIPFEHNSAFWAGYIFSMVAILAQIGVAFLAMNNSIGLKKKVYSFPIFKMGAIYLGVQLCLSLVLFIIATFFEDFPSWIAWVICIIVLGVFTILVLLTDTARDEIIKVEEETENKTAQVKYFRVNIDNTLRRASDKELRAILEKLADTAKYSDPVSNDMLSETEGRIHQYLAALEDAVIANDIEGAKEIASNTIILFEDRNALCKLYKR